MRLSRGQQTLAGLLTGLPVAFLTTTGAKSGLPRRVPVLLTFAGDKPLLISTNWGQRKYPGWHYNLSANPSAGLELNGQSGTYRARKVQGAERESYWALAVRQFPGYEVSTARASGDARSASGSWSRSKTYHRAHREHREKNNKNSVYSVCSVVI